MKRILIALSILLFSLTGCVAVSPPVPTPTDTPTSAPTPYVPVPEKDYRILFASDMHYLSGERMTGIHNWGGTISDDDRLQQWVDAVLAEHERQPFDLILLLGDYSLDWENEGICDTRIFMEKYASQLPDVPTYIIAGNHEPYTNAQWLDITGNSRQRTVTLGNNVFIMLDAFNSPSLGDKSSEPGYVDVDVEYIQNKLEQYAGYNIYLCGHRLYETLLSDVLTQYPQIKAIIYGDTHRSIAWQCRFGDNQISIIETGQFSYPATTETLHGWNWGFRDLVISQDTALSSYIIAPHRYEENGEIKYVERKVTNRVRIY